VLVDLNLPGVDGFEVLDHIKTDAFLRTIPVIVLTSSMSSEDVRKAYERHANAYIVKRFNLEELETVFRCLGEFWFEVAALPR
jgi:CheY-like chemotaxis protein